MYSPARQSRMEVIRVSRETLTIISSTRADMIWPRIARCLTSPASSWSLEATRVMIGYKASIRKVQGSLVGKWLFDGPPVATEFFLLVFGVSFTLFFFSLPNKESHSDNTKYGF